VPDSQSDSAPIDVDQPIEKRIADAVARYGEAAVVLRSTSLLAGHNEGEDFLLYVGGDHAKGILEGAPVLYWPELWGTRALLYVWDDSAAPAVKAALHNQAWRVREMGTRVVAARGLDLVEDLATLLTDEVARVRAAAARAIGAVGSLADVERVKPLLKDGEIDVRRGAQQGIDALRSRHPEPKA
jgi:hypothetical protein